MRAYIHLPPVEVEAGQKECPAECPHGGRGPIPTCGGFRDVLGQRTFLRCSPATDHWGQLRCPACLAAERANDPLTALRTENDALRSAAGNAFVEGAKWWECESTGGTMWQSDSAKAADEAAARMMPFRQGEDAELAFARREDARLRAENAALRIDAEQGRLVAESANAHGWSGTESSKILSVHVDRQLDRLDELDAENAALRNTNTKLHRRCQIAEAGVADKVKSSGGSFGRSLMRAEVSRLSAENADLREARLVDIAELRSRTEKAEADSRRLSTLVPMFEGRSVSQGALNALVGQRDEAWRRIDKMKAGLREIVSVCTPERNESRASCVALAAALELLLPVAGGEG